MPPAAPDDFSAAWQEWSNSSCQLHLPMARRSRLTPALAQPSSDTGTSLLKPKLEVLGPQAGSAGATSTAIVSEGLGTGAAWLTGLSLPLTYRHLHSHMASKPPPDT